jgi:hypothetical protein
MGNVQLVPEGPFNFVSGEASAAIEAGMAVDYTGSKIAQGEEEMFLGISKFETAAGQGLSLECGLVNVQVTGTGSADDQLIVSATAGILESSATATVLVLGFALEAWTAAATIRAVIFRSPRRPALT